MGKVCANCSKDKPPAQFPADKRTTDNLSSTCIDCKSYAAEALETVDLGAIELMSEGGPYFGKGSADGGDYFTRERLQKIADANRALAAEVKPPNKLGHSREQVLLANSGLAPKDEGEYPAAGWVDGTTMAVVDGADGKAKLVADIKKVPRKLAELFKAGAFRTRSVELSRVTSQSLNGKVFEQVVTGLAWLGAKRPAIRTLDDWIEFAYAEDDCKAEGAAALLAADADDASVERAVDFDTAPVAEFAPGDLLWDPEAGMNDFREDVQAALNPPGDLEPRYWVEDVRVDLKAAIVNDLRGDKTWIVPLTVTDSEPTVGPAAEWTEVERGWVETAPDATMSATSAEGMTTLSLTVPTPSPTTSAAQLAQTFAHSFARLSRATAENADTRSEPMSIDKSKFTDDQIASFATGFGIDEADDAKRRDLVLAKFDEAAPAADPPAPPDPTPIVPTPTGPLSTVTLSSDEFAEYRMKADKGEIAYEAARVEKRDTVIGTAVKEGRLDPAKQDDWKGYYDERPELTATMLSELPVNPDLLLSYGSDDEGESNDSAVPGLSYEDTFESRFGEKATV